VIQGIRKKAISKEEKKLRKKASKKWLRNVKDKT